MTRSWLRFDGTIAGGSEAGWRVAARRLSEGPPARGSGPFINRGRWRRSDHSGDDPSRLHGSRKQLRPKIRHLPDGSGRAYA